MLNRAAHRSQSARLRRPVGRSSGWNISARCTSKKLISFGGLVRLPKAAASTWVQDEQIAVRIAVNSSPRSGPIRIRMIEGRTPRTREARRCTLKLVRREIENQKILVGRRNLDIDPFLTSQLNVPVGSHLPDKHAAVTGVVFESAEAPQAENFDIEGRTGGEVASGTGNPDSSWQDLGHVGNLSVHSRCPPLLIQPLNRLRLLYYIVTISIE